jgi:type VI secretion system protein ImpL
MSRPGMVRSDKGRSLFPQASQDAVAIGVAEFMKNFLKTIADKRIKATIFTSLLMLVIWYGTPFVAIAGHYFLASAEHRLIAILVLAFLWGLNNLRLSHSIQRPTTSLRSRFAQLNSEVQDLPIQAEVQALQRSFKNALKQIKLPKQSIMQSFRLPTYIVLGSAQAGKTTLLKQLISPAADPSMNEKYYQWWMSQQALFIDYLESQALAKLETNANLIWHSFLKLLQRFQSRLPLQGVIFTISCQQLMQQDLKNFAPQKFSQRLQHLAGLFPQLPVYIVLTQCDRIAGFTDFFSDLTQEERTQVLGLNFSLPRTSHSLADVFSAQFDALIKRLNERVLGRLQQERSQAKRVAVKDFPLQLEAIKTGLAALVNQLGNVADIKLNACYFVSCLQEDMPINYLTEPMETSFALKMQAASTTNATQLSKTQASKVYFANDLLPTILNQTSYLSQLPSTKIKIRATAYGIATTLLILSSSVVYLNYRDNIAAVNTLQIALQQAASHSENTGSPYSYLPILNSLYLALQETHAWTALPVRWYGTNPSLTRTAEKTYQDLLLTRFLPELKLNIEQQLQVNAQNPSKLYGALKAYLMLNDIKRRDPKFMQLWFSNYWQATLANQPDEQKQLLRQLNKTIQLQLVVATNSQIITNIRASLQQIPLSQLSFYVLLDRYSQGLPVFSNNAVLTLTNGYTIPVAYTKVNLVPIYKEQIAQTCTEVLNGDWVVGQTTANDNAATVPQLTQQVQSLYLQNYAQAWQQLLTQINLHNLTDLSQLTFAAQSMSLENSSLWQLFHALEINTKADSEVGLFDSVVSTQFKPINDFMQTSQVRKLQSNMDALQKQLTKISQAANVNQATFAFATERMNDNGAGDAITNLMQQTANLPQPLQGWVEKTAVNSWHVVLVNTQTYLNSVWTSTVLPTYSTALLNKYPLFKNASAQTSLQDFSAFFSPNGVMDKFFNDYLKPFVDTSHFYWVWKNVNNQQLTIPQSTLETFMRFYLIQKMYFVNDSSQPTVKFSLLPLQLEPGVRSFSLNLDGQSLSYQLSQVTAVELNWPGRVPDKAVMQFVNARGEPSIETEAGPWALFKLLDRAKVQGMPNNPRLFKLIFDLNGNSAAYELRAENLVNPFISGIVDAFRCPDTL